MATLDIIDPRQLKTLEGYRNPKSETFGNLKQSAILAGYNVDYADQLSSIRPAWLTDAVQGDIALVQRAERNLKKYIELDVTLNGKKDIDLAKLQVDVSKFILKTLAKQKYSEDADYTPPNVQINIVNYHDKAKAIVDGDKVRDVEVQGDAPVA